MESKTSITAIILTKNEELHIERCISSLVGVCDEIIVVDSFSTDKTVEIADRLGAKVYKNPWKNYSTQFNYGIYQCNIHSEWIWRIDADEYIDKELAEHVKIQLEDISEKINGIYVKKRIDFLGRPLLHGGWYPSYHLKIFRRGHAECENRWMDEHIRLFDGESIYIKEGNQIDSNLNNLTWWTEKHNGYASREMLDMLMTEYGLQDNGQNITPKLFGTEEQRKRWLKIKYVKSPLFIRPFINFTYRYILKGGFLDGKEGFIWHILQGFWYRMLVDAKIFELKKQMGFDKEKIIAYLQERR